MKIYVGTSGYGHKEWKGSFYPEKMAPGKMLRFYAEHLGAVEINQTFYRMPTVDLLLSWAAEVPEDFVFAFKAPQVMTHIKRLRNAAEEAQHLFRTLSVMEKKLGPVLFQFPKSFHADVPILADFLAHIPDGVPCSFEFRHPSWFDSGILALLRERGCCLCMADTDDNPVEEIVETAPWGYLRLRRSDYSQADLSQWLEKIATRNWEKAFVFFKHGEGAKGAEEAVTFRKRVGEAPFTGPDTP